MSSVRRGGDRIGDSSSSGSNSSNGLRKSHFVITKVLLIEDPPNFDVLIESSNF